MVALLAADPARTCVVTDFDGTLAEIVDDPDAARPLPGVADALADLAARYGRVAVVSGRPASFLARHLLAGREPGPSLVGLYGLETVSPAGDVVAAPGAEAWRSVVAEAADRAEAERPPGARVERKGLTVTLHWREQPDLEPKVVAVAARLAAATGLVAHPAKMSIELRPPLDTDKGTAVLELASGYRAACFVGDDLGDVAAFRALDRLAGAGTAVAKVAVLSAETPAEMLELADVVVDGPAGALALLRRLLATVG